MRLASTENNSHPSLGELYRLHVSEGIKNAGNLPFIAQKVPEVDYLSTFFYEDLVRTSQPTDFEAWTSSFKEDSNSQIFELIEPYLREVYCRGKAIFIGMELRASGVWTFSKWNYCLLAQLHPQERLLIAPYSRQIYKRVKEIMDEATNSKGGIKMNTQQKRTILAGLAAVLFMLLIPPWTSGGGYRSGYGLIFAPPLGASSIDLKTLGVQGVFIVLLSAGIVFVLQNRKE